jgi:hypothetical protein
VQQLVEHSLNEDFPPAQRMKALALIGQLYEVGAFLERKETTVVHKSADIRTRLLDRLKVSDVKAKPSDALELLQEIREGGANHDGDMGAPTGGAPAREGLAPASAHTHTVSLIQSPEKNNGVPPTNSGDTVLDFDKE